MGMNYYIKLKERKINQNDLHIGKSSIGWEFNFQGYEKNDYYNIPNLMSRDEWCEYIFLHSDEIYNEEDEKIDLVEILELINLKKPSQEINNKLLLNHYDESIKLDGYCNNAFKDKDGYTISTTEFS